MYLIVYYYHISWVFVGFALVKMNFSQRLIVVCKTWLYLVSRMKGETEVVPHVVRSWGVARVGQAWEVVRYADLLSNLDSWRIFIHVCRLKLAQSDFTISSLTGWQAVSRWCMANDENFDWNWPVGSILGKKFGHSARCRSFGLLECKGFVQVSLSY